MSIVFPLFKNSKAALALGTALGTALITIVGFSFQFGEALTNNTNAITALSNRVSQAEVHVAAIEIDRKAGREAMNVRLAAIELNVGKTESDVSWIRHELERLGR